MSQKVSWRIKPDRCRPRPFDAPEQESLQSLSLEAYHSRLEGLLHVHRTQWVQGTCSVSCPQSPEASKGTHTESGCQFLSVFVTCMEIHLSTTASSESARPAASSGTTSDLTVSNYSFTNERGGRRSQTGLSGSTTITYTLPLTVRYSASWYLLSFVLT